MLQKSHVPSPIILHEEGPEDIEGLQDYDDLCDSDVESLVSSPEWEPWDEDDMADCHGEIGEILQQDQGTYLTKLNCLLFKTNVSNVEESSSPVVEGDTMEANPLA